MGKLAYLHSKGRIDLNQEVTFKDLFNAGALSKVPEGGLRLSEQGSEYLLKIGIPPRLEASDASDEALQLIKEMNGTLIHRYRTPLILRQELKPHKIKEHKYYKTPMPPQKDLLKMEKLRERGFEVEYPRAPWFTDNIERLK